VDRLSSEAIAETEPALAARTCFPGAVPIEGACLVPEEAQLRNPRHLKALLLACTKQGVEFMPGTSVHGFRVRRGQAVALHTDAGEIPAGSVCLAAGCWSAALAESLGVTARIKPVRGQIVLLSCRQPPLQRIVNEGRRYLVPRADGRLLVGSTEEDAGFDCRTTSAGVVGLLDFALSLVPALKDSEVERAWAGLRPGTEDGSAYVGRVPGLDNAFMAAGHFRSGLQRSPGTAVVLRQLICGQQPDIPLDDSRLDRHQEPAD
jgi:glycine oxidase